MSPPPRPPADRCRDLLFLSSPGLWPAWPLLPVVRRRPGREVELGVVVDLWRVAGIPGYSATVFLCNVFRVPRSVAALLALPKEVFDAADELVAAGWSVD
jgi:hypothetical protein